MLSSPPARSASRCRYALDRSRSTSYRAPGWRTIFREAPDISDRCCEAARLPSGGLYVLLVSLERGCRLRVGRLGRRYFAPGWYCYVGSAQRGLLARLRRHARRRKARHWHIDNLTTVGRVLGAWVVETGKDAECGLAAALARQGDVVVGFGASDCRCRGHLVRFGTKRESDAAVRTCSSGATGDRRPGRNGPLWWPAEAGRAKNFGKKGLTGVGARL